MIDIDDRYCKGCGICVHFCSTQALKMSEKVNSRGYYTPYLADADKCTKCRQCVLYCPDFAIFLEEEQPVGDE
jgi:2-oxoglutarate ferredoxin oxidoreductase subunit delta